MIRSHRDSGKTIGVVKVGYQDRKYTKGGNSGGFNHVVGEIGLISKLSERTELKLSYFDTAIESVYENNNYYNNNSLVVELNQG